jgi:hypothetical protein
MFFYSTPAPYTNKADRNDIVESGVKHHQTNKLMFYKIRYACIHGGKTLVVDNVYNKLH